MTDIERVKLLTTCDHVMRIPVRFIDSAGRPGVRLQCQRCGQTGGNVKQNGYDVTRLPAFDQSLVDQWEAYRKSMWDAYQQNCQAQRDDEQAAKRAAWFDKYNVYLKSSHWQGVRRRVIARDGFLCQLCARKIDDRTAQVHHLSYDTYNLIGKSLPHECVALCYSCHQEIETAKRAAA